MKFDIQTLAFIQSLIFVTQVILLFVQYRVNKTYCGIGWWVLGSTFMALGVIFMPMLTVKSLEMLNRIAYPLVVIGQIFIYIGVIQFLENKMNRLMLILIVAVFIFSYFYFMYINNDISTRTAVLNTTLATISIMTGYKLFFRKDRLISGSANFTAIVFLTYGCFLIVRALFSLLLPPMHAYSDQGTILIVGFIAPIVSSILWTFGFIIMLNQSLNIENLVEKEKMQLIFNTSPDAVLITRLNDGLIIDVNNGFSVMTEYTHDEVIGGLNINLWNDIAERKILLTELGEKGICEKMEFVFINAESNISNYVTVSLGVVTVNTNGLASPEQIITLADEALYCVKKGGRNGIEVAK